MLKKLGMLMGLKELKDRDPAEVRTLFLLVFMFLFINADTMLMAPNYKLIMAEFQVNETSIGLVASLFVFSGAIVALLWGYLVDRYPRKFLAFATIILGEVPCLLTGYVKTFEQMFLIRTLTGLAIGGIMPLIYSMIGDLVSDRERSTASAWLGLAEGLGAAVGFLLAGSLAESPIRILGASGWRLSFVLVALPNFVLAPIFLLSCREPARGGGEKQLQQELEKGLEYKRRIKAEDYKVIFKNRTNIYAFLQGVPGTIGWGVLPNWLPTFYTTQKRVSIAFATYLSALVGLGMIIGGFFGGIIGNKLHDINKKYSPLFCGVTTLIGLVFFLIMIHYPLPSGPTSIQMAGPLVIGVIAGLFITMTSSNIRAIVLNVNPPENRGAMMSLFTLTDSLGKGAGPYLGGLMIVHLGGYLRMMDVSTLFWVPCALIFLFLLTPQYPKDAARLKQIMTERALEMKANSGR